MTIYFSEKKLLTPPTERAAFSDRQAYVCAELSKLAYFKFEGGYTIDMALELVSEILGNDERLQVLEQQLRTVLGSAPSTAVEAQKALEEILDSVDFSLVNTFSKQGTQAYFCTRNISLDTGENKTIAYLVFRGTEPKDFNDIKTDVKAKLKAVDLDGDKVEFHSGFLESFNLIKDDLIESLTETNFDQLFITGHSLGGALAMVTTRMLASDTTGACYTFGAPPIGTIEIQNKLKTPVYEIINEIDVVPRLPNPWLTTAALVLLRIVRLVAKSVTILNSIFANGKWDENLETFIESMTRYEHPGYRSYLVGTGTNAKLRYNVSSFARLRWWLAMTWKRRIWAFKKMVDDHSIDLYVTKLKNHGLNRLN